MSLWSECQSILVWPKCSTKYALWIAPSGISGHHSTVWNNLSCLAYPVTVHQIPWLSRHSGDLRWWLPVLNHTSMSRQVSLLALLFRPVVLHVSLKFVVHHHHLGIYWSLCWNSDLRASTYLLALQLGQCWVKGLVSQGTCVCIMGERKS